MCVCVGGGGGGRRKLGVLKADLQSWLHVNSSGKRTQLEIKGAVSRGFCCFRSILC